MKYRLQIGLAIFLLGLLTSQANAAPTLLEESRTCFIGPFENYEKWFAMLEIKKKNFNKETFTKRFSKEHFDDVKRNIECRNFKYKVDGLTIEGYYLKPKNQLTQKLPVIIYNRGGNAAYGYVLFGKKISFLADIAKEGFIIIGSQYRGSSRYIKNNGADEFGGADVRDVIKLMDIIKEIPEADANRVGMLGWSRGSMQSYLAAKNIPSLKAIVAIAGNVDAKKALLWRPAMEKVYKKRIPSFAENKKQSLEKRSVIYWIEKLPSNIPILLLHGDKDKRVNVDQSIQFAEALTVRNHPHKLIIYPDGNHRLSKYRLTLKTAIVTWFRQYI